ncbi:hypothetical protein I7I53_03291 [Histoplasma capsulatum var. duboisii H88]|uniref:Uncharacterized protein n=1 Tax=Ajellomyces capsulatus (strain H88) TaxID=544711 RepID=A0A8A1LTM2_AJEC8|nr:hypothetical protein I7I53_03291 [Histoplasma capsulatum var. duboisii H88]
MPSDKLRCVHFQWAAALRSELCHCNIQSSPIFGALAGITMGHKSCTPANSLHRDGKHFLIIANGLD